MFVASKRSKKSDESWNVKPSLSSLEEAENIKTWIMEIPTLRKRVHFTLNNRITFSNSMSAEQKFRAKDLVWAKVESYPWWPGKVNHLQHRSSHLWNKTIEMSTKSTSSATPHSNYSHHIAATYTSNISNPSPQEKFPLPVQKTGIKNWKGLSNWRSLLSTKINTHLSRAPNTSKTFLKHYSHHHPSIRIRKPNRRKASKFHRKFPHPMCCARPLPHFALKRS